MSHPIDFIAVGAIAGAAAMAAIPVDFQGISLLVVAVTGLLTVLLPFILVLLKRTGDIKVELKKTHDLVNSMSKEKEVIKEAADIAKGEITGQLKERANPMSPKTP